MKIIQEHQREFLLSIDERIIPGSLVEHWFWISQNIHVYGLCIGINRGNYIVIWSNAAQGSINV